MKLTNTNIHNVKRHLTIQRLNKNGYDISFFDIARIDTIGYDGTTPSP